MVCLAALRQNGIRLHTLLRNRDHVTSITSCLNTHCYSSISGRRHREEQPGTWISSPCFSTASSGKSKPQVNKEKKVKKKKKDVILLYTEKREKCPLYLTFFTGLPLSVIVSGVVPYFLNLVGEAHSDMGLAYMLNVAIPISIPLAFYGLVIIWGLRFPRKMELTKDMMLRFHIIKWPGYKSTVMVDPSGMFIHRETEKIYSIAKFNLYINYTLNKRWGNIERRDIMDKLFGKYDAKKSSTFKKELDKNI